MASFEKFKAHSIGRLFQHNNRMSGDDVQHSNENIDDSRTVFNYHLKEGSVQDVSQRLSEIFSVKRHDATVLGEIIVTLPKDVNPNDERNFFDGVYDFYAKDLGEENIINAVVHKDEVTPHLHLDFVPVIEGEIAPSTRKIAAAIKDWKGSHNGREPTERLCCKDLITREYLSNMHGRLSEYIKDYLGYEVSIENGATVNGNLSVLQLKAQTLKEDIERLEYKQTHLRREINEFVHLAKKNGVTPNDIGLYPLLQKIDDLSHQNEILKNIITRQGYMWKKEDLAAMKERAFVPSKTVSINYMEGSLVDAEIPSDAIVVIELPNQEERPSPQEKLFENNSDLVMQRRFVTSSSNEVMSRQSKRDGKIYLFIKTDNAQQTMDNLMLLEKTLVKLLENEKSKGRKLYMDRMETDEYNLARSIIEKNNIEAFYFNRLATVEKSKEAKKEVSKEL